MYQWWQGWLFLFKRRQRRQTGVVLGVGPWVCHGLALEARNATEDGTAISGCFASASSSLECSWKRSCALPPIQSPICSRRRTKENALGNNTQQEHAIEAKTKTKQKQWETYSVGHDFPELAGIVEGGLGDLGPVVEVVLKNDGNVFLSGWGHVHEEVAQVDAVQNRQVGA